MLCLITPGSCCFCDLLDAGLEVIALTDHDNVLSYEVALNHIKTKENTNFKLIPGIEVNTLYKDAKNKLYYLVVYRGKEQEVFNKVTNVLTEYGVKEVGIGSREAFFKEHYMLMIKDNALQVLSTIA